MEYNYRLIGLFNESEYIKLLEDPKKYICLVKERYSRFDEKKEVISKKLAFIDAFDCFLLDSIKNNTLPNYLYPNVRAYRDFLFNNIEEHERLQTDSIMFKNKNREFIFNPDQINKINEIKSNSIKKIKDIYNRQQIGEEISNNEAKLLCSYFEYNFSTSNPYVKSAINYTFDYLMKHQDKLKLVEKEFLIKYVSYKASENLNIPPCNVYLTNRKFNGVEMSQYNNGTSYGNFGYIEINRNNMINNTFSHGKIGLTSIENALVTVAHETKHSEQNYNASMNEMSKTSFDCITNNIFRSYLSDKDYDYYSLNYTYVETETDANMYGYKFTSKLLEKHGLTDEFNINTLISNAIKYQYKFALGNKKSNNNCYTPKEYFNVRELDKIIFVHPELLSKYPILCVMYNNDGTKKSVIDLLESEIKYNVSDELTNDYYLFAIKDGKFQNVDVPKLTIEQQILYIRKISCLAFSEIDNFKNSSRIIDENNIGSYEHVNYERINRIVYLVGLLNRNKRYIEKIVKEDVKRGNKFVLGFSLTNLSKQLATIEGFLSNNSKLKENNLKENIEKLEGVNFAR